MSDIYRTPRCKIVFVDCSKMLSAYDCLKSGCDFAEAFEGAFFCHRPKTSLPLGKVTSLEARIHG